MNKIKKFYFIILIIIAFTSIITLSCVKKIEKVRIGYQKTEIYQHFFVAVDKGFFEAEGIKVEPVEFTSANLMAEALIAGRIDGTATSAFPVIFSVEIINPGQFKIYIINIVTKADFPDYILVKKGSSIDSLSALKGKKIGTYPGSTILTYTKIILKNFMDPDNDITIVQLKPTLQLQALEAGQVDAVFALEPIASVGIIRGIAQVLEEAPLAKYVMNPFPGSGSTFSSKFLKEGPNVAEKVKAGMYRALDFLSDQKNKEELRRILGKWTEMEPDVIERLSPLKYWKLKNMDKEAVQRLADLLFEWRVLEKKIDTSNLYYSR